MISAASMSTTRTRLTPLIVLALASSALLSGCTTTGTVSVPADDIATTAENGLEEQIGSRPEIDCGTDPIVLIKGKVIDCVLTDPVSGEQFKSPITIEDVDGTNYTVGIKVADAPISG